MRAFIQGLGNISPQRTWHGDPFLNAPVSSQSNALACIEPVYETWINHPQLRRMSRVLKMGNAAAAMALKDAGLTVPDSIVTGTGYGCQEDTATFLSKITSLNETALNPTPFMQSTHNTIGSQIALLLQCQGYNQTYVHDAFSFEHSLLDAMMQITDRPQAKVLVGGVEEMTDVSHAIKNRFRIYRTRVENSLTILQEESLGTIDGEGAAYFVLAGNHYEHSKAVIEGVLTLYNPPDDMVTQVRSFLEKHRFNGKSIDLVLSGKNGFAKIDQQTDVFLQKLLPGTARGVYKHLSGEHCVASSFALWVAAKILHEQAIPECVSNATLKEINTILIYNPYFNNHHSFIIVSRCPTTSV
jgi:3-oxoacyl-[acyl-carrier-protein] synthase II